MQKGQTNNPNGRPVGSTNKVSRKTKELIALFVEENFSEIMDDLKQLEPKDRVQAFINLLKYVIPPARDEKAEEETANTVGLLIRRLFPDRED